MTGRKAPGYREERGNAGVRQQGLVGAIFAGREHKQIPSTHGGQGTGKAGAHRGWAMGNSQLSEHLKLHML